MMRGLPFWLSMSIIVILWIVFSAVIAKYAPSLRARWAKRAIYALLCAIASAALIAALMSGIAVFFN